MKALIRWMTALAVVTALAFQINAADDPKAPKGKGPVVVPGENVLMTCPHCKDDYMVKVTKPSKGTEPAKAVVGTHLCEKCSTKLVTKGAGKSKKEVVEHTCKGCKG